MRVFKHSTAGNKNCRNSLSSVVLCRTCSMCNETKSVRDVRPLATSGYRWLTHAVAAPCRVRACARVVPASCLPQPVALLSWDIKTWDCSPTEGCQEASAHLSTSVGRPQ